MSIIDRREIAYVATVQGFDTAAAALDATDAAAAGAERSIAGAGDAATSAGAAFAGAEAKAAGLAGGLDDAGKAAKQNGNAIEAFEKRVGAVSKLLGGFGLLAIPGALSALADFATGLYGWTDAGKAAAAQAEATEGAIDAMVARLIAQADATRVATDTAWALVNAQVAQELSSKGLTTTTAEIIATQAEYAKVLRDLAIHKERNTGLDRFNERSGTAVAGAQTDLTLRAERLRGELVALNGTWEEQRAQLASAAGLLRQTTAEFDRQGGAVKATAATVATEVRSYADVLYDMLAPGNEAAAAGEAARAEELRRAGEAAVESSRMAWGGLADQRAAFHAASAERVQEARREAQAQAASAAAWAASGSAAIGAVAGLAEAVGVGAEVVAAIRVAEEIASAASEGAKAAASAAVYDIPGAIAHGAAAALHVAAAVKWGSDALGGGGGGGASKPATPAAAAPSPERTVSAGDRDRGGGGDAYYFSFQGQPLYTVAEMQDGIARALDASGYRRGAARVDVTRIQRRG